MKARTVVIAAGAALAGAVAWSQNVAGIQSTVLAQYGTIHAANAPVRVAVLAILPLPAVIIPLLGLALLVAIRPGSRGKWKFNQDEPEYDSEWARARRDYMEHIWRNRPLARLSSTVRGLFGI